MKALTTILALAIIAVSIGIGVGIVARVDEQTIALLIGTLIGIMTAAPCAAAITVIVMRNKGEYSWRGGCIVKRNDEPPYSVTPYARYQPNNVKPGSYKRARGIFADDNEMPELIEPQEAWKS